MANKTIRVVTRASNGTVRTKEFENFDEIFELHQQVGIDDCSTDLSLRGLPLFRGLVGPIPESKTSVRYESPEVFETLTKEWALAKSKRRRRSKIEIDAESATSAATDSVKKKEPNFVPIPKVNFGSVHVSPIVIH
jgi:hypothetical protein